MPSSPTARNRFEKQGQGENLNTWGDRLNTVLDLADESLDGVEQIAVGPADVVLTSTNYVSDQARNRCLELTGSLTANRTVTAPGVEKLYLIDDQTTRNGFTLTIKTAAGSGYALCSGPQWVKCNGTDFSRGTPRLDQVPAPTAAVDMNGQKLSSLAAGTATTDAVTKAQMETAINNASLPVGSGMVKISLTDTTGGWLADKLVAGDNITLTPTNIGGNEALTVAADIGDNITQGRHTIGVLASAMIAQTTNGPTSSAMETATNKVMVVTKDFDAATAKYAQFPITMPRSWDESTVTVQFIWTHGATTTNFDVVWAAQAVAVSDDDALDAAWGTAQTVTKTGGTAGDEYISAETPAITIAGSPVAGDVVWFRIYRDATAIADTLAVDAGLIAAKVFITYNAGNDA